MGTFKLMIQGFQARIELKCLFIAFFLAPHSTVILSLIEICKVFLEICAMSNFLFEIWIKEIRFVNVVLKIASTEE